MGTASGTFVVSIDDLGEIDAMDGEMNSTLASDRMLAAPNSLYVQNVYDVRFTPDVDGDGDHDLSFLLNGTIRLANAESLEAYDVQDGTRDGESSIWCLPPVMSTATD